MIVIAVIGGGGRGECEGGEEEDEKERGEAAME
jgi:hypothetical protein